MSLDIKPIWVSTTFTEQYGYTSEEFKKMHPADLMHPEEVPAFRERIRELLEGDPALKSADRKYRHKNGQTIWTSVTSTVIRNAEGKPTHIIAIFQDISARKRQEIALHESQERLRVVVDAGKIGIFERDLDAGTAYWAETFRDILGISETCPASAEKFESLIHQEDLTRTRQAFAEFVKGLRTEMPAFRIIRPDGELRWVQSFGKIVRGGREGAGKLMGALMDITEAKTNEEMLISSEMRAKLALESSNIGTWEIDRTTNVATWSNIFKRLLGLPEDFQPSPGTFLQMVHPEDRARATKDFEDLLKFGPREFLPIRVIRADGKMIWMTGIGFIERDFPDGHRKMIGAIIDITKAKDTELLIEAQRMKLAAAAKMSALGEMAAGLAHEINNPVAIIHGHASLLRSLADRKLISSKNLNETASVIEQTSERISRIVKSLRAFARDVEQDAFQKVPLIDVIRETAELSVARFQKRGIEFRIDPFDESLKVECRPVQISQVLLNLLNNAYDAVENMQSPWVRISVVEEKDFVEIKVTDSGKGIPPELQGKLFQPFFTTKEIGKGTGLGLSLSSGIMETQFGSLSLDPSSPHTCFVARLPKRQS